MKKLTAQVSITESIINHTHFVTGTGCNCCSIGIPNSQICTGKIKIDKLWCVIRTWKYSRQGLRNRVHYIPTESCTFV